MGCHAWFKREEYIYVVCAVPFEHEQLVIEQADGYVLKGRFQIKFKYDGSFPSLRYQLDGCAEGYRLLCRILWECRR